MLMVYVLVLRPQPVVVSPHQSDTDVEKWVALSTDVYARGGMPMRSNRHPGSWPVFPSSTPTPNGWRTFTDT